jgi:uroporphyrin-3 C-methyltransferase
VNTEHPDKDERLPGETSPDESSDHADRELESAAVDEEESGPDPAPIEPEPRAAEPPPPPPAAKSPRRGGFLAFLAFLFALAALAGTAWMWWQDQQGQETVEGRAMGEIARLEQSDSKLSLEISELRNRIDNLPAPDSAGEIAALERRLQGDLNDLERMKQSLQEQQALSRSLQIAAETLQRRLSAAESALTGVATRDLDAGGELDLAEVDYLLKLANERLRLFSDPVAADETLALADAHLAAIDDPIYLGVRQDIAAARRAISALDLPDYFAIGSRLDDIQAAIPSLPFKSDSPEAGESAAGDGGWWQKVKNVFSGLVTVRRSTELERAQISLQDQDYVRQRLWLQVEIAHLALMRRDQDAFRQSLGRVQETLSRWFDGASPAVENLSAGLDELDAVGIEVGTLDISAPWSTLRQLRQLRSQPAAPPAEQAPVEPQPAEETAQETAGETQG